MTADTQVLPAATSNISFADTITNEFYLYEGNYKAYPGDVAFSEVFKPKMEDWSISMSELEVKLGYELRRIQTLEVSSVIF